MFSEGDGHAVEFVLPCRHRLRHGFTYILVFDDIAETYEGNVVNVVIPTRQTMVRKSE